MTSRRHLTLVAAAATLMAAAPIGTIFDSLSWFFRALVIVAMISGAAWGVRSLRGRLWAQLAAMIATLLVGLTMFHGNGTAILGLIPTSDTLSNFATLFSTSGEQIRTSYVPAPDLPGLLFLTSLGIGGVAILVDFFAVGMRRPALAGLPMLAIYSVPVAVYAESVSAIPFVIGATGYLWLLVSDNIDKVRRFGRRFTGEGRGVDLWEPSPLAATGRRLAVAGVLVAVLLPVAVPGMTAGFLTQFGFPGRGGEGHGRGGTVDLFANLHGKLTQPDEVDMVRVTTTDPKPFYLRFAVADDVKLNGFGNRPPDGRPVSDKLPVASGIERMSGDRFTAEVEVLETFDMPMVPVYAVPVSTRGLDASWSYDPDMQVVYSPRSRSGGKRYGFDFVRPEFRADQLRTSTRLPDDHEIQRDFASVPDVPAVQEKVNELIKGKTTVYDQVRALYDFFSHKNGFVYDLSTEQGTTGQHITDFLETKRGFCEQYAAALTWMVRAAGIPARVAFGFTRGSNFSGGVYTLTTRNLHAWTEVYFDGFGWVPFDATPSVSVSGSAVDVTAAWAPDPNRPDESPIIAGPTLSPGPGASGDPGEEGPDRNRGDECPECPTSGQPLDEPVPAWIWWTGGGGLAALVALLMPALRRQTLRRRRSRRWAADVVQVAGAAATMTVVGSSDLDLARRRAHEAWDELMDTMVDYRITVDMAETPRSTAERLIKREGLDSSVAEQARLLGQAEEKARYALRPASPDGLVNAVQEVRRTFAIHAGRWVRLTAVLLPPSVVQRWRAAVAAATGRVSQRMTDMRVAMRRVTRPLRVNLRPRTKARV